MVVSADAAADSAAADSAVALACLITGQLLGASNLCACGAGAGHAAEAASHAAEEAADGVRADCARLRVVTPIRAVAPVQRASQACRAGDRRRGGARVGMEEADRVLLSGRCPDARR